MPFFKQPLSTEWTFKDRDDETLDAWMPVSVVPSTVQQDLIANKKLRTLPPYNMTWTGLTFLYHIGLRILT